MKKILKPFLIVLAFAAMMFAIINLRKNTLPNEVGVVTIEYVDITETISKSKDIKFNKESKLVDLLKDNFNNVSFEYYETGPFLIGFEDYITPSNFETYLAIYVNNEYSMVGISSIELLDGMIISIRVE